MDATLLKAIERAIKSVSSSFTKCKGREEVVYIEYGTDKNSVAVLRAVEKAVKAIGYRVSQSQNSGNGRDAQLIIKEAGYDEYVCGMTILTSEFYAGVQTVCVYWSDEEY